MVKCSVIVTRPPVRCAQGNLSQTETGKGRKGCRLGRSDLRGTIAVRTRADQIAAGTFKVVLSLGLPEGLVGLS